MIRERSGKGFARRLRGPAGALLALAGLALGAGPDGPAPAAGPDGWEVRLTVSVRGEFSLLGGPEPVAGDFVCRARWEGRLEPDGDDFLLVHVRTEVLEWSLGKEGGPPAPALRLNYALRTGREVEFDFEVADVALAVGPSPVGIVLEMPRPPGRGPGPPGLRYGDLVRRGSSRIAVPASDFGRRSAERSFSWEWRRIRTVGAGRPLVLVQSHAAEAVLAVAARAR